MGNVHVNVTVGKYFFCWATSGHWPMAKSDHSPKGVRMGRGVVIIGYHGGTVGYHRAPFHGVS